MFWIFDSIYFVSLDILIKILEGLSNIEPRITWDFFEKNMDTSTYIIVWAWAKAQKSHLTLKVVKIQHK